MMLLVGAGIFGARAEVRVWMVLMHLLQRQALAPGGVADLLARLVQRGGDAAHLHLPVLLLPAEGTGF